MLDTSGRFQSMQVLIIEFNPAGLSKYLFKPTQLRTELHSTPMASMDLSCARSGHIDEDFMGNQV